MLRIAGREPRPLLAAVAATVILQARPGRLLLLEARPAENRPPLRGLEGHRRFAPARGAGRGGLDPFPWRSRCWSLGRALGFATAAPFWFVAKTLVGEKRLFSRRPDEAAPAVDALQSLVLELHWPAPKPRPTSRRPASGDNFRRLTQGGGEADTGPKRRALGPVPAAPWPWSRGPNRPLVQIPALLLAAPLPGQRLLCAT